jgi:hypothetical protein
MVYCVIPVCLVMVTFFIKNMASYMKVIKNTVT